MYFLGYDTETGLIKAGLQAPPWACGTFATWDGSGVVREIEVEGPVFAARLHKALHDPRAIITGAYTAYDMIGPLQHFPELRPSIWETYAQGRIIDVQLREKLLDLAQDTVQGSYSLAALVLRRFGVDLSEDKTDPDAWRLRYNELRGVPLALWPEDAISYAQEDAVWALLLAQAQQKDAESLDYLTSDGFIPGEQDCARASFALGLISAWGVRTDLARVRAWSNELEDHINRALGVLMGDQDALRWTLDDCEDEETQERVTSWLDAIQAPDFLPLAKYATKAGQRVISTSRKEVQSRVVKAKAQDVVEELVTLRKEQIEGLAVPAVALVPHEDPKLAKRGDRLVTIKGESPIGLSDVTAMEWVEDPKDPANSKDRPVRRVGVTWSGETLGEVDLPRTATMGVATGADVVEGLGDPVLDAYVEYKSLEKLQSTYLPVVESGAVRPISTRYDPLKVTLRTGSSHPNIQNIPQKGAARPCFTARPGWVLSSIDLDGAELCGWSELCYRLYGYSTMGDALNAGRDPHTILANRFPEYEALTYEDLIGLKKAGDAHFKRRRDLAKIPNFSRMGGGGARRVREEVRKKQGLQLSLEMVQTLFRYFEETWTEAGPWLASGPAFGTTATVILAGSGVRVINRDYSAYLNNQFQGLVAQAFKEALFACARACYMAGPGDPLYLTRIVIEVHDEIISEHPEDRAHEAAEALRDVFLATCQRWFRHVRLSAEPALMRHWYKAAATVRDDAGRLVIWTPEVDRVQKLARDRGMALVWQDQGKRALIGGASSVEGATVEETAARGLELLAA